MSSAPLVLSSSLSIPRSELSFHATRSGGPGGQHVNTSSTRIELWWNLERSAALSEPQRELLRHSLAGRIDGEGWLRLVESGSRSQLRNRAAVTERFVALLRRGLRPRKARRPTQVPPAERQRRLQTKRQRGALKQQRQRRGDEE